MASESTHPLVIRHLYLYLIASIGLFAFLFGAIGDLSILIRALSSEVFGPGFREQMAWFTGALLVGLPVWILPWRRVQLAAELPGQPGGENRRAVVRKIFLYFILLLSTLIVILGLGFIAAELLRLISRARNAEHLLFDLGQAIALSLVGGMVWLYHGMILRNDKQLSLQELKDKGG